MQDKIIALKKLNAAYIAAQEYDRCPNEDSADNVDELFATGVTKEQLVAALSDNEGRRPDEIAGEMSELIKEL